MQPWLQLAGFAAGVILLTILAILVLPAWLGWENHRAPAVALATDQPRVADPIQPPRETVSAFMQRILLQETDWTKLSPADLLTMVSLAFVGATYMIKKHGTGVAVPNGFVEDE